MPACFATRWKFPTERIWDPEMFAEFEQRHGYGLQPFVACLLPRYPDTVQYDVRACVAERMLHHFYHEFAAFLQLAVSRSVHRTCAVPRFADQLD